jgi:hypothetical protein
MMGSMDYRRKSRPTAAWLNRNAKARNAVVQPKLEINSPGDRYEREADAMAEHVVTGGRTGRVSNGMIAASIQRKCSECEEEEKKKKVMRKAEGGAASASSGWATRLANSAGGGRPIGQGTRSFMETAFHTDFSAVRVHTDGEAGAMSRDIQAKAFTYGKDIYFNGGEYAPESASGRLLLAHELTHVVQQRGAVDLVQRDLATPHPKKSIPAQADLTSRQIQDAVNYNRERFDAANTRGIQDIIGTQMTGVWTEKDILAVARLQEEYALKKDGQIRGKTFEFLSRELDLEATKMGKWGKTMPDDCLVSFRVVGPRGQDFGRINDHSCYYINHTEIEAEFSDHCNCKEFGYRQFVKGSMTRTRDGKTEHRPAALPGGIVPPYFVEDTNTDDTPLTYYGHRDQKPAVADRYFDKVGAEEQDNQESGCHYHGIDSPGNYHFTDCRKGDEYNLLLKFQGQIVRNGKPIQVKEWTGFDLHKWKP